MKKFAKYLPVEGEIEVPCIVLETLTNGKTELFQVDNFNDINLETQKLAKLFLCSRDIQVGDRFDSANGTGFTCDRIEGEKLYSIGGLKSDIEEVPHSKKWCYKVIGEISPDAVWVTEGMEFDDDELLKTIIYKCREPENNIPLHVEPLEGCIVNNTFIKIKCPTCKQFH